jgi:hypothetical protein
VDPHRRGRLAIKLLVASALLRLTETLAEELWDLLAAAELANPGAAVEVAATQWLVFMPIWLVRGGLLIAALVLVMRFERARPWAAATVCALLASTGMYYAFAELVGGFSAAWTSWRMWLFFLPSLVSAAYRVLLVLTLERLAAALGAALARPLVPLLVVLALVDVLTSSMLRRLAGLLAGVDGHATVRAVSDVVSAVAFYSWSVLLLVALLLVLKRSASSDATRP